jgi:hypothetical protein
MLCDFTQPTYRRFVVLLLPAILTTGRRTVTNRLRTGSTPASGLFGLFSVVAWRYAQLPASCTGPVGIVWAGKTERTSSDAITGVRRRLWADGVFATPQNRHEFAKPSRVFRNR